ncbi:MAG: SemiSWEET transporter [Thermoplasmata archaeon]|nr:SemiSWEET transporter [Thermoplasmata archaeon]MBE3136881.1 SemiSWEET transporter [Thermoplasmata archaeon]MBE3141138.1 SemiSWEET transporter [Thermoplasmata archaeon]
MSVDMFTWLGVAAGAITSIGFIPQLFRGYKTKRLDDISYWMPLVLAFGMSLWLMYGILRDDLAIIIANTFGIMCNLLLILMKKWYS